MKKLFVFTCAILMSATVLAWVAAPVAVERALSNVTSVSDREDNTVLAGRYHARKRVARFFSRKK